MNINDKNPNRSSERHDDKGSQVTASQKVKEAMSAEAPAWDVHNDAHKRHGDKEANAKPPKPNDSNEGENERSTESDMRDDANAEYIDHQDINETNDADFDQPKPMSEGLSSIYPGKPSTKEEREALAKERLQEMKAGNRKQYPEEDRFKEVDDPMAWKKNREDGQYIDTERGNYERHSDYQDRQGREKVAKFESEYPSEVRSRSFSNSLRHEEDDDPGRENVQQGNLGIARGEVPSGHRDPNFSPARQNYWGDEVEDDEIFGDQDSDDQEVRRKQDEGARPWDTTSDYETEYDMDEYDERDRKQRIRRRQEEEELSRQSYKRKTNARAFHKDRKQHYTDENE